MLPSRSVPNDRPTASGEYRSLHSWGRAVDIGDVEITFDDGSRKRYRYSRFSSEGSSDYSSTTGSATAGAMPSGVGS